MESTLLPAVPQKAVAEVEFQKKETYGRAWSMRITDGRANPLMGRKAVGIVLFGVVTLQWLQRLPGQSPHPL